MSFVGTQSYMAPEIVRNAKIYNDSKQPQYDNKVDIYALGILILRMLDLAIPHDGFETQKEFTKRVKSLIAEASDKCPAPRAFRLTNQVLVFRSNLQRRITGKAPGLAFATGLGERGSGVRLLHQFLNSKSTSQNTIYQRPMQHHRRPRKSSRPKRRI